ncbi:Dihydroxy-acid/6-phosphogluconate dehydratase [Parasponia andersonii]|uniref:Dihydroxy-acid/6-phosphogluconate dehydratase n=1 Tax=Parasponia andersonii TaxID=3476 RepID=A0A2P5CS16_PARAD|nr:Dihydroxy-acid/6-phosphogluconate dehydratase [Parasponia andersonii]
MIICRPINSISAVLGRRTFNGEAAAKQVQQASHGAQVPRWVPVDSARGGAVGRGYGGKAQVGITAVWYEGSTCNMHLLRLSEAVKEGVRSAGLVGLRFNTVGASMTPSAWGVG